MASPPHKFTKLAHAPPQSSASSSLATNTSKLALSSPRSQPPPPPPPSLSSSKRLGLSTNNDKGKVKKLTLKPKASAPTSSTSTCSPATSSSSAASLAQGLTTLTRAVRAITSRPPSPTPESLQALYTICEAVVFSAASSSAPVNNCEALYERVKMEIERAAGEVRRALAAGAGLGGGDVGQGPQGEEEWLKAFEHEGTTFTRQILLVRSVVLQLDRTWVLQTPGVLSIWDLGLDIFRNSALGDEGIASKLTSSLLGLIQRERNGDLIPRPLLRSVLSLLRLFSPTVHSTLFVSPFLSSTRTFYHSEGSTLIASLDAAAYLKRVTKRLEEEKERCEMVVGSELEKEVMGVVEEELIRGHVEGIAEKDTAEFCKANGREELSTLFTLLQRINKLDVLRSAFLAHLKAAGLLLVLDQTLDAQMVPNLITFRHTAQSLVAECFAATPEFAASINQAFEFFVNKRENKPAEMMAKYLDAKLRSGNRGMDDAELESTLNDVLYLFRFTQGKDIFEAFYKRDLAKRLLLNKSASFDAERSMLLKLKDECGAGFTAKLELMFKDMELSADVMRAYNSSLSSSKSRRASSPSASSSSAASPTADLDLSVSILSQGSWPSYPPFPILLPPSLSSHLTRFKSFYVSKHSGRALTWAHGLDTCSLRAQFGGKRKELLVSLAQGVVLLRFNEVEGKGRVGVEEIAAETGLERKELLRTLQSLACGKVRVLVKHPKGREVNDGDQFSFNEDFKDDHVRIKINQIQQKETVEENKSTTDRVFTDRSSHLQLAIVRIMKARKTLKHSELVMEVITQIGQRFKVEPSEIKKSISSLIDREYMRRAEDSTNVYEYVA